MVYSQLNHIFIVPIEFVKQYPLDVRKNQRSTKKIIICEDCNSRFCRYVTEKRRELYAKHNITLDTTINRAKLLARSILRYKSDKDRNDFHENNKIRDLERLTKTTVTDQDIQKYAVQVEYKNIGDKSTPAEYIVSLYLEKDKLKDFEDTWVNLFLDKMKPQYLPKLWKELYFTT
jgi:hypothetical protein